MKIWSRDDLCWQSPEHCAPTAPGQSLVPTCAGSWSPQHWSRLPGKCQAAAGCCAAVRCAPTLGVFRDLHSGRTVARRLRHRAHQVPGCLQWVRGHPTISIICSSPNLSMHEMVCQLCNTGGGDVVTPWPLLRSGSLQLTFSQSTFIMTTTASSQHNMVSLGHILCFKLGCFASKID